MSTPIFYILDDDGEPQPVDLLTGAHWIESGDRTILRDTVGRVDVSTVFLCIDHQWHDGPPVLWETMIFGGVFDRYQRRYTTKLDALTGHLRAVQLVQAYATAPRRIRKAVKKRWQGNTRGTHSRNVLRWVRRNLADV